MELRPSSSVKRCWVCFSFPIACRHSNDMGVIIRPERLLSRDNATKAAISLFPMSVYYCFLSLFALEIYGLLLHSLDVVVSAAEKEFLNHCAIQIVWEVQG